jgi:uncharacterized membrane protein
MRSTFKKISAFVLVGLMLFFCALMFRITYPYFSFRYDVDFLLTKQTVLHITAWRWAFYVHIGTSILVLFFGVLQFIRPVLNKAPKIHRLLGKIYVAVVLFLAAPSGFILGLYANGGWLARTSFVSIAVLWWYFTFSAYRYAVKGKFKLHKAAMYRSYALTLSAITLRTYVYFLSGLIYLPAKDMYTLVAWLSWVPNLIVAEILIRRKKTEENILLDRS